MNANGKTFFLDIKRFPGYSISVNCPDLKPDTNKGNGRKMMKKSVITGILLTAFLCSVASIAAPAKMENGKVVIKATDGKVVKPFAVKGDNVIGTLKGYAVYEVAIPADGEYVIWGSTCGFGGNADSFFMQVDEQPAVVCDIASHKDKKCHWRPLTGRKTAKDAKYKLTKGVHKITIKGRETGVAIDKIGVTEPKVKL